MKRFPSTAQALQRFQIKFIPSLELFIPGLPVIPRLKHRSLLWKTKRKTFMQKSHSLKIEIHPSDSEGNIITLLETLEEHFENYPPLIIPAGFQSDGCSIPEFLWSTISPAIDPRTLRAGLCHDFLYRVQPFGWSRRNADRLFYYFCREDGLSLIRSLKAYWGIRLFGWRVWRTNRKRIP